MNNRKSATPRNAPENAGSSLVITLAIVVLVTIMVLGVLSVARLERASAHNTLENVRARGFSQMAADVTVANIREAISAAENTTSATNAVSKKFWASQPGRIAVFNSDGTMDSANTRDLFSTGASTNVVDLNRATFSGRNPIIPKGTNLTAPVMNVRWVNVLNDPLSPASSTNQIIGRYAYWVDDESTKININAADGTLKGTTNSFGAGTPPEVNLQALKEGVGTILSASATAIAQRSGIQTGGTQSLPFNSVREILQTSVGGAPLDADVYESNFSDLTFFSRTPELNLFGEPKIYLMQVTPEAVPRNVMLGNYADTTWKNATTLGANNSKPLTQVYPITGTYTGANSQLPTFNYDFIQDNQGTLSHTQKSCKLPQYFMQSWNNNINYSDGWPDKGDYELGKRIALYLKGINSKATPINWPLFLGAGANGYTGKYTDRQLDSIALQILTILKNSYQDHLTTYSVPLIMKGFLSGQIIGGVHRGPRATEVTLKVETVAGDPPGIKFLVEVEHYLPAGFRGAAINNSNTGSDYIQWNYGNWNYNCTLNFQDAPQIGWDKATSTVKIGGPAPIGGYWMNQMLDIRDQNGVPVGIDLYGHNPSLPDPDQLSAQKYHPWTLEPQAPGPDGIVGTQDDPIRRYMASGPEPGQWRSVFSMSSPAINPEWKAGDYHYTANHWSKNFTYLMRKSNPAAAPPIPPVTSIKIRGGLTLGINSSSGSAYDGGNGVDIVPLESLRGKIPGDAPLTPIAVGANDATNFPDNLSNSQTKALLRAVIPIPVQADGTPYVIPIPGVATFHMQVADPMVNGFPGDWVGTAWVGSDPPNSELSYGSVRGQWNARYQNGLNSISKPDAGGDPQSAWFPEQSTTIAKSQRFPSTGYLQYIHTGMMPDKEFDAYDPTSGISIYNDTAMRQKGTPFRLLNFSPSSSASQETDGGSSYPDWALLDLFTVPAALQPLTGGEPVNLTWGGATAGRINPNSVLYPFGIQRATPIKALVKGLQVSTSYDLGGNPVFATIDDGAASIIATGVCNYVSNLGRPLMLPGEICNVPEIADYLYTGVAASAISRNDLVRQIVGNLSTRSNTFMVWAIGESIQKKPGNTNYGEFEPGDVVLGKNRTQYLVERYMDPGADGVYGNASNPGPDGIVGTPDDPTRNSSGIALPEHPIFNYPIPHKFKISSISQIDD